MDGPPAQIGKRSRSQHLYAYWWKPGLITRVYVLVAKMGSGLSQEPSVTHSDIGFLLTQFPGGRKAKERKGDRSKQLKVFKQKVQLLCISRFTEYLADRLCISRFTEYLADRLCISRFTENLADRLCTSRFQQF